jgi:hypothetical protein
MAIARQQHFMCVAIIAVQGGAMLITLVKLFAMTGWLRFSTNLFEFIFQSYP